MSTDSPADVELGARHHHHHHQQHGHASRSTEEEAHQRQALLVVDPSAQPGSNRGGDDIGECKS